MGEGNAMVPADAAAKIDGMGFGVRLGNDVDLALELLSFTDQDAKQLYDIANGFLALMRAGETTPETAQLLNSLHLRQDGPVLAASMRISEAQIRAQMEQRAAGMGDSGVASAESVPSTGDYTPIPPPQPQPRRSGGIRIYGINEDPVEVPTQER
jgi:hypothetical protein